MVQLTNMLGGGKTHFARFLIAQEKKKSEN